MIPNLHLEPHKAGAELCTRKGGLAFFVQEFWDIIVPTPLIWNWHMQVLCDEYQEAAERVFKKLPKDKDIIINVPPGSSKTLIISVFATAWELARAPWIRTFVGSYSDPAVSHIADNIRLVMRSDKYRKWFPNTRMRSDRDSLHNGKTTANGEFFAFTVGGSVTGKHGDILKIDDPINPKEAASDASIKTANDFFDQTLPMRKANKDVTLTVLIMQRLANNDPSGHQLDKKKGEIHHICLPGTDEYPVLPEKYKAFYTKVRIKDKIVGILDVHRLTAKNLIDALTDLGSYGFAGQIGQQPTPAGGVIWQKWFKELPDWDFPDADWGEQYGSDWDLAYTKDDENAASAYVTSFKYKGSVYISDIGWDWLEFPQLIHYMKSKPSPHYIEAKASGKSAKQTLSHEGVVAIEVPVKGGADKVLRARMSTPMAEAGMVYIKKSLAEKLYNDPKQGILFFPKGLFKDLADALAQCLQRHKTGGMKIHEDTSESNALDDLEY